MFVFIDNIEDLVTSILRHVEELRKEEEYVPEPSGVHDLPHRCPTSSHRLDMTCKVTHFLFGHDTIRRQGKVL